MSPHLSQVLAGLYELRTMGLVDLDFRATGPDDPYEGLLLAEVSDEAHMRRVCFDMRDGPIIDRTALAQNDVYFKRTYTDSELRGLSANARAKVQPFGLELRVFLQKSVAQHSVRQTTALQEADKFRARRAPIAFDETFDKPSSQMAGRPGH